MEIKKFEKVKIKSTGEIVTALAENHGRGIFHFRKEDGEQGLFLGSIEEEIEQLEPRLPETRMVGFKIPNHYCRHYVEPFGCNKDKELHTCCIEECTMPDVFLGIDPTKHVELKEKE